MSSDRIGEPYPDAPGNRTARVSIPQGVLDEFMATFDLDPKHYQDVRGISSLAGLAMRFAVICRRQSRLRESVTERRIIAEAIQGARDDGYDKSRAEAVYGALVTAEKQSYPWVWKLLAGYASENCPEALDLLVQVSPDGPVMRHVRAGGWVAGVVA